MALASAPNTLAERSLGTVTGRSLTVDEIRGDRLTQIAARTWLRPSSVSAEVASAEKHPAAGVVNFSDDVVRGIYLKELRVKRGWKSVPLQRVMVLEISQYLERYLWPFFDPETSSNEHVLSIVLMVNEKVTRKRLLKSRDSWSCSVALYKACSL